MGLRIQTNMQALNSQKALDISTQLNDSSMQKLSSGYRINKSADDAAGLAISEKLKSDIRGINMAKRNANDGISMLQVAEGGMNEIGNIISRLRELSVQAASDTIGNNERSFIDKEYTQLKDEIDRIAHSTEYNGTLLIVGKSNSESLPEEMRKRTNEPPFEFQVGKSWVEQFDSQDPEKVMGKFKNNPVNIIRANFDQYDVTTHGLGFVSDEGVAEIGTYVKSEDDSSPATASKMMAQKSIAKLDEAISRIAGHRADLGAVQNRLNSTISNLATMSENFSAANSRIRDTDFAEESSKNAQALILKQAGVSVLAQANQSVAAAARLVGQ